MTLEIYGHPSCPGCQALGRFLEAHKGEIEYVGHPITELPNLKAFLKFREGPEFDSAKAQGKVGIPCLVVDGKVTRDWKGYFRGLGYTVEDEAPKACDISGKGC